MSVLSIDIASRGYRDFGLALLESDATSPRFPKPADLGLEGKPEAGTCAGIINAYCQDAGVSVLLLDGPQGWRLPGSPIQHMRLCERVLNTPGKTGTEGNAKPAGYLSYIKFSIELFQQLRVEHGWELLVESWHRRRGSCWLVESFPSAAWRTLGLKSLPSKAKAGTPDLQRWRRELNRLTGWELPTGISHDELQAAVALTAGKSIADRKPREVVLSGVDPIRRRDGVILEGLIANPRWVPEA